LGIDYNPMNPESPLRVAVFIDHRPNHPGEVGGLAGTWEQISRVASGRDDLDLTVFFLGDSPGALEIAPNVRHALLRPVFGTERLPFLRGIPTNTDLAPFHLSLFRRLGDFQVLHTTDAFHAFAKTALRYSRRHGTPLVNSIQTDIIGWARIHTPGILRRIIPNKIILQWLFAKYRYLDRRERSMEKQFGRYVQGCRAVFYSHQRDLERIQRLSPSTPVNYFRRGIDLEVFAPTRRDRAALNGRYDIPPERTLLLFVGRIDVVKGALIAAETVKGLLRHERDVHLLMVGDGAQREAAHQLLGDRITLTGNLPQHELGWIYASADLLLFPSEAEVWPNVVMEARACGLPVMACEEGAAHVSQGSGIDVVLLTSRDPREWCVAAEDLLKDEEQLKGLGRRGKEALMSRATSWERVLEEDLLPVWRRVVDA
jgi:glycosyltransferase involved in cell wall biosynthesis